MSDCIYCGETIKGAPDTCPECGAADPVPENIEPAAKSPFELRFASCCRTRLKYAMMLIGMAAFTWYLIANWLPADASFIQIGAFVIAGSFIGAILGVYAAMTLAFFYASISSGDNISASET